MLSIGYLFEEEEEFDMNDMKQHFENRTNYHISLVNKYIDKIIALHDMRIDEQKLRKEKETHDETKFQEPEYEPYLHINWKYHMKDQGVDYSPGDKIEKKMQEATFHHVKSNHHHPEAWDSTATVESINGKDRDQPPTQMVDATKMPITSTALMVADWCAMSEERGNSPADWAKMNINKRWKFNPEQEKFIYDLIDQIWGK